MGIKPVQNGPTYRDLDYWKPVQSVLIKPDFLRLLIKHTDKPTPISATNLPILKVLFLAAISFEHARVCCRRTCGIRSWSHTWCTTAPSPRACSGSGCARSTLGRRARSLARWATPRAISFPSTTLPPNPRRKRVRLSCLLCVDFDCSSQSRRKQRGTSPLPVPSRSRTVPVRAPVLRTRSRRGSSQRTASRSTSRQITAWRRQRSLR